MSYKKGGAIERAIQRSQEQALPFNFSDEELIEFKNNIASKLEKANKELDYLGDILGKDDPENKFEKEQLEQMIARQQTFINNLNEALQRIENKTYGICRITGKLIDKTRLLAVPHATLSLEAKLAINNNPAMPPAVEKPKKEKKKTKPNQTEDVTLSISISEVPEAKAQVEEKQSETVQHLAWDLRNFKTLISNKIDEANQELKYLQTVLHDRNLGIKIEDYEDMAPAEVEALIDRKKSYIGELESALDRIKKKTYGICEETASSFQKMYCSGFLL
jgi:RNA polymerase-binding transcription factor DksA